jgi:hypothetical protein
VLASIRAKYPKAAIVREVVLTDPIEQAIYNRWAVERSPRTRARLTALFEKNGAAIADTIPEDWDPETAKLERRIDGLMLASGQITAIEVKVSVADFRRDTDIKRRAWRDHSHRFVYATPAGLLTPEQIPANCGLWEVDEWGEVTVIKRAVVNKTPLALPSQVITAMFYRVSNYERRGA